MAKTLYSASVSLDGYITGPNGDMSWLAGYLSPNPTVDDLTQHIGALLVGRTTYGGDDPYKGMEGEGEAFGGGWSGPQFVLTHRPPERSVPGTTFVSDLTSGLEMARQAAGDSYINVLGASVARQCLERGELDEILVCVTPILLGDGTRLFDFPGGKTVQLEQISLTQAADATNLWYRVVKD